MKIIVFIDWFYPAYKAGGPIKSVFNIIDKLRNKHDFLVVCSNHDLDKKSINVVSNERTDYQGIPVYYLDKLHQTANQYKIIFEQFKPNLVYVNGLFSPRFSILPILLFAWRLKAKTIVAPRGMLGKGALTIKPLKKFIFLRSLRLFGFAKNIIWHASTVIEKQEIINQFGREARVKVAQNLTALNQSSRKSLFKEPGDLKLCFISRISSKKNIHFFLSCLNQVNFNGRISFDIYGPIEDESYWEKCIGMSGFGDWFHYKGALKPFEIGNTLANYHFFVLPSLNENYGHGIAESLISGVPVLLSDQTPWLNLKSHGVGYDLPINDSKVWVEQLEKIIEMDHNKYKDFYQKCIKFSKQYIVSEDIIEQNFKLFEDHES